MSLTYEVGNMLKMCRKFTDYILKFNNIEEAYKEIEKEKKNYSFFDFMALTKLVNKLVSEHTNSSGKNGIPLSTSKINSPSKDSSSLPV